jgi:hypothetical protein
MARWSEMQTTLYAVVRALDATAWAVAVHLWIGGLMWSAVGRSPRARRCARSLRRAWPAACLTAGVSGGIWWLLGEPVGSLLEPAGLLAPGLFTLVAALATSGCYLVLHAARLEASGALRPARAQVRLGGKAAFLAVDMLLVLLLLSTVGVALAQRSAEPAIEGRDVLRLLAGAAAWAVGGFVFLLAGLSGKPRPSGYVAAAFYALGLALVVAASDPR